MDREFQKKLLDAFMSDYQRVYLVDLLANQIYMQVNSDKTTDDTTPWMQAAIDPTVSFEKFISYYSEYSVAENYQEWFEKQMNVDNIRTTLHGRNSFIVSCPLVTGDRRRIEVRRFDDGNGIAETALICIPYSIAKDDMERFIPDHETYDSDLPSKQSKPVIYPYDKTDIGSISAYSIENVRQKRSMNQSVSTYEIDVTEYEFLRGDTHSEDIFYPVEGSEFTNALDLQVDSWLNRIVTDNVEEVREFLTQENILLCYELGNREPSIEYMVRDRFGNEVWLNHKMLLSKDESTGHIKCLFVLRDITDQVAARAENRRRMNLIEGLTAEYSSVYFVDLVKDRYYIYRLAEFIQKRFEKGFCDSFDRSMEYFLENGVYSFDRENVSQKLLTEGIRNNLSSRRDYSFIFRAITNTRPIYYRCMVVRIDKNEGDATEALVGFADVDEEQKISMKQKQLLESALEQARNAGKAKTMFLSNMSHDIRTPMNAVMGFAELARLNPEDVETVKDSLDKILSSGEHLLQLIDNILDISRIESGRMILKEEPCHLREQIDEVVDIFLPQMTGRNIKFTKTIETNVVDEIFCDTLKIKQIMINLLSNAVKYTRSGGWIELFVEKVDAPEGYAGINIHVKDNGIGMSQAFIKKLFDPFEREESSAISPVAGSGLGMPICKGIVDAMGGTITALSKQNEGTEMIVHLEFRVQDTRFGEDLTDSVSVLDYTRYRIFKRPVIKFAAKDNVRILLVEDNRMNREIAGKMLKHLGYDVVMCDSGDEAVELVGKSNDYDLVLMDVHMPGLSGYQATEKIRKIGGMKTWLPIVAMTADAFESDIHHALRSGMNAFISKPVNLNTLQIVIERFTGGPLRERKQKAEGKEEDKRR